MTQRAHKLLSEADAAHAAAQWAAGIPQREIAASFDYKGASAISSAIERFLRKYAPDVTTRPTEPSNGYRSYGGLYSPGRVEAQGSERLALVASAIAAFEFRNGTKVPYVPPRTDPMPGVSDVRTLQKALHAEISRRKSLEALVLKFCDKLESEINARG